MDNENDKVQLNKIKMSNIKKFRIKSFKKSYPKIG